MGVLPVRVDGDVVEASVTGVTDTHAGAIERKRSCWDGAVPTQ
jgi:hypothetical protein